MSLDTLLKKASNRRECVLSKLEPVIQAEKGQYFTPKEVAMHMVNLVSIPSAKKIKILDPGAGSGMLTAAIVSKILSMNIDMNIEVTAVENDMGIVSSLKDTLKECELLGVSTRLIERDFIDWALSCNEEFDLVIQNPPYHKIKSKSDVDLKLKSAGYSVPNLYAAFMILGLKLLKKGGQQVSITPRSWMNGTYYSNFRKQITNESAITAIHTFESRSLVFGDMDVLQESIIASMTKFGLQEDVLLLSSQDHTTQVTKRLAPSTQVITDDFVFVPATDTDADAIQWMSSFQFTLMDLGLTVSTGKVVDFRCREYLLSSPIKDSLPMIYPANLSSGMISHPRNTTNKPQWFNSGVSGSSKFLVPAGTYVLIKRFSAKEEKRRIVASVWSSKEPTAFDNKLNYIHLAGQGLDEKLAYGICRWLNSTRVDNYFRVFSGHTQVNATDLRKIRFPSTEDLLRLAEVNDADDKAIENIFAF